MAKQREVFLSALEEENENDEFVSYVEKHNSRDEFDLSEFIQGFARKDHQKMWSLLVSKVEQVVLSRSYLPQSDRGNQMEEDGEGYKPVIAFLSAVAQFAQIFLEVTLQSSQY